MSVEFVLGRAGSGKTNYCYSQIEEALKEDGYTSFILLVPDQFTLEAQLDLSKRLRPGLLRAEVASFNTLAREVFKEVGKMNVPTIEDLERMMILKKVIEDHKKELVFFKKNINNTGFIEEINRLITVFEQVGIGEEGLNDFITSPNLTTLFKSKFEDIHKIYHYFQEYISGHFITVEKNMSLLAQNIYESEKLADSILWIDGFYGFTGIQLNVLGELMKKCKKVVITLPSDKAYTLNEHVRETHPFYESIKTYQKLLGLCEANQIVQKVFYLEIEKEQLKVPELNYMEEKFLNSYGAFYKEPVEHIKLKVYSGKNEEIEQVAKEIIRLTRDEAYRYHDIALIVGDLASYKSNLKSVFSEYQIPYFLDMKRNIHTNSLVAVIEGVLEVITCSYSYKSMMSLLRTDMLEVGREAIDPLENYILAYGIKGKGKWHEVWKFKENSEEDSVNAVREQILRPIDALENRLKETRVKGEIKIKDITTALYYFLEDIRAYESLEKHIARHKEDGNRLLELETSQIWGQVMEVFERLVELLGDQSVSLNAYKKIISTSFSYLKMGIIPPSKDQVLIGTLERTRLPRLKALFILGTNEGLIPQVEEGMTLFSDMDKIAMGDLCKEQSGPKERLYDTLVSSSLYASNFSVYTALTRATDRLYISAALADENGKLLRPSMVYYRIKRMFKDVEKPLFEESLEMVSRPSPTFGYVGSKLRDYIEGRVVEEEWKDIVSWYLEHPIWKDKLENLITYLFYTNQQHYLKPETTHILYDEVLKTNISKLENFRQCACCYFMRYGIKAEERKIFSWDSAQIGTLFHVALEQYPKELKLLGTTWVEATKEQMDYAVKGASQVAIESFHLSNKEEGKYKYTVSKLEKMTKRAITALTEHLKKGEFIPEGYEINFAEGATLPPIHIAIEEEKQLLITGQIDRVDIYYKEAKESYIKILDYKTGNKNFSLLEVYYGLQLQLLLYLDAYLKINKEYKPGGVFYFHINNPYVEYRTGMTEDDLELSHLKQFKLSGLALDEEEVIHALDKEGKGTTIPVTLNKDGSIKKGSSVATLEQFDTLENHIIDTIRNLGKEILEGKVSAKPYRLGDKHPCEYCKYLSICQFDESEPDNEYEKLENINKDKIWEKLCMRREEESNGMD